MNNTNPFSLTRFLKPYSQDRNSKVRCIKNASYTFSMITSIFSSVYLLDSNSQNKPLVSIMIVSCLILNTYFRPKNIGAWTIGSVIGVLISKFFRKSI
ncbi:hypothetical protein Hokovirus_3_292 [Hokovirus HKV1]|uniref:Uncharacterized protein n=1 Tax=Hokovirus HKV1 TaxID=1977638 RepID=A0A1V0SH16_9VIRU|nr:hypothetical protein Hokovirus_3_292 [Hokovirus HKV1]